VLLKIWVVGWSLLFGYMSAIAFILLAGVPHRNPRIDALAFSLLMAAVFYAIYFSLSVLTTHFFGAGLWSPHRVFSWTGPAFLVSYALWLVFFSLTN